MFDTMGKLFPGFHDWTRQEMQDYLVTAFAAGSSRYRIARGFDLLRVEMVSMVADVEQWVNGSFATSKHDPGDLDLLNVFDKDEIDNLPVDCQQRLLALISGQTTRGTHDCDSYCLIKVSDTHPDYSDFRHIRTYWMGEFGFDRNDSPKGIVRLRLAEDAAP